MRRWFPITQSTARWLLGISGSGALLAAPALVAWYWSHAQPLGGNAMAMYAVLFLSGLLLCCAIARPARGLALAGSLPMLLIGLLTAASNGGVFELLALPSALVAIIGIRVAAPRAPTPPSR